MKSKLKLLQKKFENYWLSILILAGVTVGITIPSAILMLNNEKNIKIDSSSTLVLWVLLPSCYCLINLKTKKWNRQNVDFLFIGLIWLFIFNCLLKVVSMMEFAWCHKLASFLDTAILKFTQVTFLQQCWIILFFLFLYSSYYFFSKEKWVMTYFQVLKFGKQLSLLIGILLILLSSSHLILYVHSQEIFFRVSSTLMYFLLICYLVLELLLLIIGFSLQKRHNLTKLVSFLARKNAVVSGLLAFLIIYPAFIELNKTGKSWVYLIYFFKHHANELAIIFSPLIFLLSVFLIIRKFMAPVYSEENRETSGNFGSAKFAGHKELEYAGFYDASSNKILSGNYLGRDLYLPLKNKLTLSPQGGGKTSCSSVNVLLTHPGNTFVFDIKGELWATTARFRREVLGKEIVAIDPYNIRQIPDFAKGKSPELLKEYCFNPFDWIPEYQGMRDRMINSFAASFIINEGGTVQHFDDNAKILIRGYIDYMVQALPKEARNLSTLYELLSEHQGQAQETFAYMSRLTGRAQAAANQISRVGSEERGSILSTSYRQIDWMSDYNVKACLAQSNFDLKKFITGNMDIFVILPEDQIKEHQRFVRMLLSLIVSQIVQIVPSSLPQTKMLFLLDELAQLGYCPDVEQAIEVLRARKLVVWTVFQTLSQIKLYKKPDLFLGSPIKQIFTNDDVETMQWVQTLGGKKTILTKTLSTNEGDSRQKMQFIGGSMSSGEGESIQETGADLIQLNEIRELGDNDQFIFIHGLQPIKCKKIRYYQHFEFENKYDCNPLEKMFDLL